MPHASTNSPESRRAQRRERERQHRRGSILSAAEKLFAEKGYRSTSVEEVADLAEVSVGTVYFYFKNKGDILAELLKQISWEVRNLLGEEFRKADASLDGIGRAGTAFLTQFCSKHPDKALILLRESAGQESEVEERRKWVFEKLAGDLMDAISQVANNIGVPRLDETALGVAVQGALGVFERIAYQYLVGAARGTDMSAVARDAISFLVGGLSTVLWEHKTA